MVHPKLPKQTSAQICLTCAVAHPRQRYILEPLEQEAYVTILVEQWQCPSQGVPYLSWQGVSASGRFSKSKLVSLKALPLWLQRLKQGLEVSLDHSPQSFREDRFHLFASEFSLQAARGSDKVYQAILNRLQMA